MSIYTCQVYHSLFEKSFKKTKKARVHAGETAEKQLAFLWARSLGGESALKLLNRLGHLNDVIDIAAQNSAFDFAFELARGAGVGSQVKSARRLNRR